LLPFYRRIGNEVAILEMDVDNETYPLESITNYKGYENLKLLEKPVKQEWKLILMQSLQGKKMNHVFTPDIRVHKKDIFNFWCMN
jgi:hypothetical protein